MFPRRPLINYLWSDTVFCALEHFGGGTISARVNTEKRLFIGGENLVYIKENGAVYNHGVAFKIASDCVRKNGDEAYNTLKMMFYDNPENENNGVEPYMLSNMYIGPECPYEQLRGFAPMSGNTGTAPWIYLDMTEYILGIIPDFDGLKIQPCLPRSWDKVKVTRKFRGAFYNIEIKRSGEKGLWINGKRAEGNVLPVSNEGKEINCLLCI